MSALQAVVAGHGPSGSTFASAILIMPLVPSSDLPGGVGQQKASHALVPMPLGALSGQGNFNVAGGSGDAVLNVAIASATTSGPGVPGTQSPSEASAAGGSSQLDAAFSSTGLYFELPPAAHSTANGKPWVSIPVDLLGTGNQKIAPSSLLAFVLPMDVPVILSMIAQGIGSVVGSAPPAGIAARSPASGTGAVPAKLGTLSWYSGSIDVVGAGRLVPPGIRPLVRAFGGITAGQAVSASIGLGTDGSLGAVVLSVQPVPTGHAAGGSTSDSRRPVSGRASGMQAEEVVMVMLPPASAGAVVLPPASEVLELGGSSQRH